MLSADTIDDDMMELCMAKYVALKNAVDTEQRYRSVAKILERANNAAQMEVARKVASRPRLVRPILDIAPTPAPLIAVPAVIPPPIPTTAKQISLF